jgi:hypothetical protein
LPNGSELLTLRDAANYITTFPTREHDAPEWRTAIEALMLVAEHGGPTMMARIGVMRGCIVMQSPPRRRRAKGTRRNTGS